MQYESPTWLDGVGALLGAILYTLAAGLPGLIAGIALIVLWYTVPTLYTVAFGQLVVAALFPRLSTVNLVLLEFALLAVLVGPSLVLDNSRWRVVVTSVVAVVLGGCTLVVARWSARFWPPLVFLVVVFAASSYGLHRYERVALGLVEDNT